MPPVNFQANKLRRNCKNIEERLLRTKTRNIMTEQIGTNFSNFDMDYEQYLKKIFVKWKYLHQEMVPEHIIDELISSNLVTTDDWQEMNFKPQNRRVLVSNLLICIVRNIDGLEKYSEFLRILRQEYKDIADKLEEEEQENPVIERNVSAISQMKQKRTLIQHRPLFEKILVPDDHVHDFVQHLVFSLDDFEAVFKKRESREQMVSCLFEKIIERIGDGSFQCLLHSLREKKDKRTDKLHEMLSKMDDCGLPMRNKFEDHAIKIKVCVQRGSFFPKTSDIVNGGRLTLSFEHVDEMKKSNIEDFLGRLINASRSPEINEFVLKCTDMKIIRVTRSSVVLHLKSETGIMTQQFIGSIRKGSIEDIIDALLNDNEVKHRLVPGRYKVKAKFETDYTETGKNKTNFIKAHRKLLEEEYDPQRLLLNYSKGEMPYVKNIPLREKIMSILERSKEFGLEKLPHRKQRTKLFLDNIVDWSPSEIRDLMEVSASRYVITELKEPPPLPKGSVFEIKEHKKCEENGLVFEGEFEIDVKQEETDVVKWDSKEQETFREKVIVNWKHLNEELYPRDIVKDLVASGLVNTNLMEIVKVKQRRVQVFKLIKCILCTIDGKEKYDRFMEILKENGQSLVDELNQSEPKNIIERNVSVEVQMKQRSILDTYRSQIEDMPHPADHLDTFVMHSVFSLDDYGDILEQLENNKEMGRLFYNKIVLRLENGAFQCLLLSLYDKKDKRTERLHEVLSRAEQFGLPRENRTEYETIEIIATGGTIYQGSLGSLKGGMLTISIENEMKQAGVEDSLINAASSTPNKELFVEIMDMSISSTKKSSVVIYLQSEAGNIKFKFVNSIINGSIEQILSALFNEDQVKHRLSPGNYKVKVKFESASTGKPTALENESDKINIIKANRRLLEDEFDPMCLLVACSTGNRQKFRDIESISSEAIESFMERFKDLGLEKIRNRRGRVTKFLDNIGDCSTDEFIALMKLFANDYVVTKLAESVSLSKAGSTYVMAEECRQEGLVFDGEFEINVKKVPPIVTVLQTSYLATTESCITLQCTVSSEQTHLSHVYWEKTNPKGDKCLIEPQRQPQKYSGCTPDNPSITIFNISKSDEGDYTCYATNNAGIERCTKTNLRVAEPPSITVLHESYSVTANSYVSLMSTIDSDLPLTRVYWENIGTKTIIKTSIEKPSLTFSTVGMNDAGYYICCATNSAGTGRSRQIRLEVLGKPPSITVLQESYSASANSYVSLMSSVDSDLPLTRVYWEKIGTKMIIETNIAKPSLTFPTVGMNDAGYYICCATNSAGTGRSRQIRLEVLGRSPSVIVEQQSYSVTAGSNAILNCNVTSDIRVTNVYWEKHTGTGRTIINKDDYRYLGGEFYQPTLTILNVKPSDAGEYTCFATNSVGTGQSRPTSLIVKVPPSVTLEQISYSVIAGSRVILKCKVTSDTFLSHVYWERNTRGTKTIIDTTDSKYFGGATYEPSLTILSVGQSDAGEYTCFATNSAGTGQSIPTTLSVIESPVRFDELSDDSEEWRHIREITIPNLKRIEDRLDLACNKITNMRMGRNVGIVGGLIGAVVAPFTLGWSLGWTTAAFSAVAGSLTIGTLVVETIVEGGALDEAQKRIDEDKRETEHLRQRVTFYMERGGSEEERRFAEQLRKEFPDAIINVVKTPFKDFVTSFVKTDVGSVFAAKAKVVELRQTLTEELNKVEKLEKEYRDRRLGRVY